MAIPTPVFGVLNIFIFINILIYFIYRIVISNGNFYYKLIIIFLRVYCISNIFLILVACIKILKINCILPNPV